MQPGGRVVNIASIAGVLGLKNRIAYSTTKAGRDRHDPRDGLRAGRARDLRQRDRPRA